MQRKKQLKNIQEMTHVIFGIQVCMHTRAPLSPCFFALIAKLVFLVFLLD